MSKWICMRRKWRDFMTVGMPDTAVRESRERIKSALMNSGFGYPNKSVTINLAPANVRKEGAGFDLPMALGILGAMGTSRARTSTSLSANSRSMAPSGRSAARSPWRSVQRQGHRKSAGPIDNAVEAAVRGGRSRFGCRHLAEVVHCSTNLIISSTRHSAAAVAPPASDPAPDFRDVRGQTTAKRGLEVAAPAPTTF